MLAASEAASNAELTNGYTEHESIDSETSEPERFEDAEPQTSPPKTS